MITYDIDLCLGVDNQGTAITVKCCDTGVNIRAHLHVRRHGKWRDTQEAYTIPAGCTPVIRIAKPDKTYFVKEGIIQGGAVLFETRPHAFTAAGTAEAEVAIYDYAGKRITTASFAIHIPPECTSKCEGESENYVDVMSEQIKAAIEAATKAEKAVAGIGEAVEKALQESNAVLYAPQERNQEEKTQARLNMDALGVDDLKEEALIGGNWIEPGCFNSVMVTSGNGILSNAQPGVSDTECWYRAAVIPVNTVATIYFHTSLGGTGYGQHKGVFNILGRHMTGRSSAGMKSEPTIVQLSYRMAGYGVDVAKGAVEPFKIRLVYGPSITDENGTQLIYLEVYRGKYDSKAIYMKAVGSTEEDGHGGAVPHLTFYDDLCLPAGEIPEGAMVKEVTFKDGGIVADRVYADQMWIGDNEVLHKGNVDTYESLNSENPVQNKVITQYIYQHTKDIYNAGLTVKQSRVGVNKHISLLLSGNRMDNADTEAVEQTTGGYAYIATGITVNPYRREMTANTFTAAKGMTIAGKSVATEETVQAMIDTAISNIPDYNGEVEDV